MGADLVQPRACRRRRPRGSPRSGPPAALLRGGTRRFRRCLVGVRARVGLHCARGRPLRPGGRGGARGRDGSRSARRARRVGAARRSRVDACRRARCCTRPSGRRRPHADRRLGGDLPCPGAAGDAPATRTLALASAQAGGHRRGGPAAHRRESGAPARLRRAERCSLPARHPAGERMVDRPRSGGPDRDADAARSDRGRTARPCCGEPCRPSRRGLHPDRRRSRSARASPTRRVGAGRWRHSCWSGWASASR